MAQSATPNATTTIGSYTDQSGGTTDIHLTMDDDPDAPNNADYVQSPASPSSEVLVVALSSVTDPASSANHKIRAVLARSGTAQIDATVELRQGYVDETTQGTLIATLTETNVTDTFTLYEYTLSAAEADAITDYADLYLRIVANQP